MKCGWKTFLFFQLFAFHCMLLFSLILPLNGFPAPFIIPTSIRYWDAEELLCVDRSFVNNSQQCLQTRAWSSVGPSPRVCYLIMCLSSHRERRLHFSERIALPPSFSKENVEFCKLTFKEKKKGWNVMTWILPFLLHCLVMLGRRRSHQKQHPSWPHDHLYAVCAS